jgi:hypothetical protein
VHCAYLPPPPPVHLFEINTGPVVCPSSVTPPYNVTQTELSRRRPSVHDAVTAAEGATRLSHGIIKAACDVIARLSRSSGNQSKVGVFGCALLTSVVKSCREDVVVLEAAFRAMSNAASSNGTCAYRWGG